MITFGLTGGIASGKSTVTRTFRAYNIPIVDADMVAREVVEPGSYGYKMILDTFGNYVLAPDLTLNRMRLGQLVFSNPESMDKLNNIMGPLIQKESARQLQEFHEDGYSLMGYDAPLLFETGNYKNFYPVIVVHCSPEQQIERLMKRGTGHGPLTREEAMARINSQMPVEQKIAMADFLIDSSGTISESIYQTEQIILKLKELKELKELNENI